jgi:curved DNA-binding protein CbpA
MHDFEDYYEILGVSPTATSEEIKRAYLDKSYLLHPDRLAGVPESAKNMAEGELKKVNVAYDTLKDPRARREYDVEWRSIKEKAKPVVEPAVLRFDQAKPHEVQKGTFVIRNLGGPYQKINISNPDSWVRITNWTSLSDSDELPLRVEIEAEADHWGKSYSENISVMLDDAEARVSIQLQTVPEPAFKIVPASSSRRISADQAVAPPPVSQPTVKRATPKRPLSSKKLLVGAVILIAYFVVAVALVIITRR